MASREHPSSPIIDLDGGRHARPTPVDGLACRAMGALEPHFDVRLDGESDHGGASGHVAMIENRRIEMTERARPPFDGELESILDAVPAFFTTLEPDSIAEFRA